jgi:hypothetical protein
MAAILLNWLRRTRLELGEWLYWRRRRPRAISRR